MWLGDGDCYMYMYLMRVWRVKLCILYMYILYQSVMTSWWCNGIAYLWIQCMFYAVIVWYQMLCVCVCGAHVQIKVVLLYVQYFLHQYYQLCTCTYQGPPHSPPLTHTLTSHHPHTLTWSPPHSHLHILPHSQRVASIVPRVPSSSPRSPFPLSSLPTAAAPSCSSPASVAAPPPSLHDALHLLPEEDG